MNPQTFRLEENLRLYPFYQLAANFLAWLPLFFLYFSQYVSLSDALLISSAYYFCVFILEIPSGYLSDRFGRKPILIAASFCAALSYAVFLYASSMHALIVAQCLLAGFFALKSGSDTSLLYDSLVQLNRKDDYAQSEAQATKFSMLALAVSSLVGGLSGYFNLHIAYALSCMAALVSLLICTRFTEPERTGETHAFAKQMRVCFSYLKKPVLLWLFAYFIIAYSLEHIPAEFNQPYVKLLQSHWFSSGDLSSVVTGIVGTLSLSLGAIAAAISIKLLKALGLRQLLIASLGLQTIIIAAMAVVLHPAVLILIMFRNFTPALINAPILSAIAPHVESAQRATYLSIQSLAGRLGFAITLFSLSKLALSQSGINQGLSTSLEWSQLSLVLRVGLLLAIVAALAMLWSAKKIPAESLENSA